MQEIVNLLPVLLVSVTMNLFAGLYYNIGTNDIKFDKAILIKGVIKAFIICSMFVGTAYCFEMTDLSAIGIEPKPIMLAAITLYMTKALTSLAKILGVDTHGKK